MKKKAIIVHSGGMDSSLCLALACREFGQAQVLSLSFSYGQRHAIELAQAAKICQDWQVDHVVLTMEVLQKITHSALLDAHLPIERLQGQAPNTLVVGRNGLMARIAAIHAEDLGAHCVYMGVMALEEANSGYRDCNRHYMDLVEAALRLDLADPSFEIRTPLIQMTKKETMKLAHELGMLEYLLNNTVTCYEGIMQQGCQVCPACLLRNEGLRQFVAKNPSFRAFSALR